MRRALTGRLIVLPLLPTPTVAASVGAVVVAAGVTATCSATPSA